MPKIPMITAKSQARLNSVLLEPNQLTKIQKVESRVAEAYFNTSEKRALYVEFFNRYLTRILAGTDFVAASSKDLETYQQEVEVTSSILSELDDAAFRAIALGQNYFDLAPGLNEQFEAPKVCSI